MAESSERTAAPAPYRGLLVMLVAAMLGFFGMQVGPGAKPASGAAKSSKEKKTAEDEAKSIAEKCPPLLPLASYLGAEEAACLEGEIAKDAVWAGRLKARSIRSIQVMVATIPDPDTVTYAHYAHQAVESLRRAPEGSRFNPDRHWFPWFDEQEDESKKQFQPRNEHPGVLLFRRSEGSQTDLLLVMLASETPTRGVNQPALRKALDYAQWLSSAHDVLQIVGPSYSGSALSLSQTIQEKAGAFTKVSIITGTATNPNLPQLLKKDKAQGQQQVEFSAVIEDDAQADARMRDFLVQHRNMKNGIASVTEEGTFYASGLRTGSDITYTFPMEISQVRNAYQKDPDLQEPAPKSGETRSTLELRFSEQKAGYESIPNWAGETAVFAKEFALRRMGDQIAEQGPSIIKLGASDVRDVLFVGGFLRKRFDDAQMILLDADVLYGNTSKTLSMRGALSVATYPLLLEAQAWEDSPGRLQFSSQFAHGVFNAFRAHHDKKQMVQYSALQGQSRPPLWLTVYSRGSSWPVALLPQNTATSSALQESETGRVLKPVLGPQHAGWVMLEAGLLAVSGVWIGLLLPSKWWKRLWPGAAQDAAIVLPALLATGLLLALNLLFASVQSHYWQYASGAHWISKTLAISNAVAVVLLLWTMTLMLRRTTTKITSFAVALVLWCCGVWLALLIPHMEANEAGYYTAQFFVQRAFHVSSGVSPVVPLVVFLALILLGAVSQLMSRAIAYWLDVKVAPGKTQEPDSLRKQVKIGFWPSFAIAIVWTIFSLTLFRMYTVTTIESPRYTLVFLVLFEFSVAFLTYAFVRLIRLYLALQKIADAAASQKFDDTKIQEVKRANTWGVWTFHFHNAAKGTDPALCYAQAAQTLIQMLQCQLVFLMGGIVLGLLALQSYPFEPSRTFINYISGFFLVIGGGTVLLFGRIESAPFLSQIYGTEEKSSLTFYWKAVSRLALPLIAVLAAQFPDVGEFLVKMLMPFLNAGIE